MSWSFRRALLALICILVGTAQAAKVVRVYNPWLAHADIAAGHTWLVNYSPLVGWGPNGADNLLKPVGNGPWLELVLPATLPAGPLNFVLICNAGVDPLWYDQWGKNGSTGGDMDLGTPLATSDTVWLVPSPLPNGPAKILTKAPKEITVMLWNPWEHDATAQRPSMQIENGAWKVMDTARGAPGWYSTYSLGFTNLSVLFRNADSTKHLGIGGVGLPIPALFDSVASRNDTVWVWTSPEPSGVPRSSAVLPRMRTVMLLNPWDGNIPFQRPMINFGGGNLAMRPDPAYCGWAAFQFIDRSPQVTFANARTGQRVGATGFGSSGAIDLGGVLAVKDTAWITTAAGTGVPTARSAYTGEKGMCEVTFLAATVYDFDTAHPNFEEGSGGSCGLVKGMVAPTLGPDRKPRTGTNHCKENGTRIVDQYLATQWFRPVDSVNAATCRDIPLGLDSVNGNYKYDNTSYFPIDDFTTLANGKPNPYRQMFNGGSDNKPHNFHYCLESHGEFDYKKGQRFSFRGDDDVWFFIDNRIAVDLGGVHNPESASVLLDTMKLVEGRTYNFDFFYCERQTTGANMRIETSMNLRTPSGFRVADTLRAPGVTSFDLYISQKLGQGCASNENVQRTAGRFTLGGPIFEPPIQLPSGVSYGGIDIDPTQGKLVFDSAAIKGLPPGIYTLRILPAGSDTAGARSIVFVVPLNAEPHFLAKPAYAGLVGTNVKVQVVSRTAAGLVDPNPVAFVLHPIAGLRFFRDSLLTSEILAGDTLNTGVAGASRPIWVRGEAVGSYTLRVGFSALDTVDLYPGISFQGRILRYVDAAGLPLAPVPAIDRDVRTSELVRLEAVSGSSTCLSCADTVLLAGVPGLRFLDLSGKPVSSVVLVAGKASFRVQGVVPVSGGLFRATFADSSASAPWSPVTFRAPSLRFVDTLGGDLPAVALEVGTSVPVGLRVAPAFDSCVACDAAVRLSRIAELVPSLASNGVAVDSVRLVGRAVRIWLRATAPVASASVVAVSDSLWASDTLAVSAVPLSLRFVDSLGADLPAIAMEVFQPRKVWLQVVGRTGACLTCDQTVRLGDLDLQVRLKAASNGADLDSVVLSGGRASFWIVSSATSTSVVIGTASTLWASDSLRVSVTARPPDSAFWYDRDGDGGADSLVVHLAHPWRPESRLQASWPTSSPLMTLEAGVFQVSGDSLTVAWAFPTSVAPLVTEGIGSRGLLSWDGRVDLPFAIGERIAPVPLRAQLRYGATTDTIRIPWSEEVAAGFRGSDEMILQERDGIWSVAAPLFLERDTVAGELVLLYGNTDPAEPQPGDSLRFSPSGALHDRLGNAPRANARRVVLQGTDRPPLSAVMRDADGDGRADRVVLRFRAAPKVTEAFRFSWPGKAGLPSRSALLGTARSDSGGRRIEFDLDAWEYGYTSCPSAGCADLGQMLSVWGTDTARQGFPVLDEVPPVPMRARLRFGAGATGPDTLLVELSEPVRGGAEAGSVWFATGRPSVDPEGRNVPWIGFPGASMLDAQGQSVSFLVDTGFAARKGDSLRISSPASAGTVSDRDGNRPGTPAAWVPVEFGPHPLRFEWKPMPSVRRYDDWTPPVGESPLQILVKDGSGGWTTLDGARPGQDTSHYGGVWLRFNRTMRGGAYLYDNLGIFVADVSFDPLVAAIESEGIEPDERGDYEVWVAWNGTSKGAAATGAAAVSPSGVYIFRIVAHYREGDEVVTLNQVFRTGWKR